MHTNVLEELENYDWNQVINFPKKDSDIKDQVINYYSRTEHFTNSEKAKLFVEKYLKNAIPFNIDAEILKFASDQVTIDGTFLEMGVCTGRTINFIAALNPTQKIYGFDSFKGLPQAWERPDTVVPEGSFALKNERFKPPVLRNVILVVGLFQNTLPQFKKNILKDKPISFLHIDCDIYSSTSEVFSNLGENIVNNAIILFDELYNYPGYEDHEFKAFTEFLNLTGRKVEYLAFNQYTGQVAVRIL